MGDPITVSLVDVKNFLMEEFFRLYKEKASQSTDNYFKKLVKEYITYYACFIGALIMLLLYFFLILFGRIKEYMWMTNLYLKVLPLDVIPKNRIHEFKSFISS